MRIKIIFESQNQNLILPLHYNHLIQSLIYNVFSKEVADKLHNEGYNFQKRIFKLFTFSRILEKGEKNSNTLKFKRNISFYFSSPFLDIVKDFGTSAFNSSKFTLLNQEIYVSGIEVVNRPLLSDRILIKMLSPVTIHSTLEKADGSQKYYYYKPNEKEFSKLIEENAKKKFFIINQKDPTNLTLEIRPYKFSVKNNLSVVMFKNTPIEAYTGIFELKGSKELIETTYLAGLGDKNPEGFGMWEVWKGGENA
ncbi:MAG: CRISPR-associated endoribonuclease Cas6 [Caldisericaceae bacterium]